MNIKYYTPNINEFHIGFEFESKYILCKSYCTDEADSEDLWSKCALKDNDDWFWSEYNTDATPNEFRVKYLDREDIESLGFKYSGLFRDGGSCTYGKSEWTIWYYRDNTIRNTPDRIKIIKSHHGIVFEGDIKNKSELKTLLEQLGVK